MRGGRFTTPPITEFTTTTTNITGQQQQQQQQHYIRPKRKRNPHLIRETVLIPPRAECTNPLDRLCEKLLDWDIINITFNRNNDLNENEQQKFNRMKNVLDSYESYSHYISIWEPLLIAETQASIYSSLTLEESYGNCRVIPLNFDDSISSIMKLQCSAGTIDSNSSR